jgi:hypothetical protein
MSWERIESSSSGALARRFLDMFLRRYERQDSRIIWRGEPRIYEQGIVPSIDRPRNDKRLLTAESYERRLEEEKAWYCDWWEQMLPLVLPRDLRNPKRGDDVPELDWLNFAAHHGCPTRLVDWAESPWVALYFACSKAMGQPGRVWAFDTIQLEAVLHRRWDDWGVPSSGDARDISKAAFTVTDHRWVVTQYNHRAPLRMASQQGLFTIASRLGERHDGLLDELVPEGAKWVVQIQSSDKPGLLDLLRGMGVHHESLQYPMLDQAAGDVVPRLG